MQPFDSATRNPVEGKITYLSDRRQRERRVLRGTAYLALHGHPRLPSRLLDISISGVSIAISVNLPTRTECNLRFPLGWGPNMLLIETAVVVEHSVFSRTEDGFRTGLQFKMLSDQQIRAIESYVRE